MLLQKGQKVKLEENVIVNEMYVKITATANFNIDISCFGLDSNDKLSNEDYMIFYNQKNSPQNEIALTISAQTNSFIINLTKLPESICKLVFTAVIDSDKTMQDLSLLDFTMKDLSFQLKGSDFQQEKAIMIVEIYKKENVWRLGVNGQGFNGGLEDLLLHFGGTLAPTAAQVTVDLPSQQVAVKKISLEKKFEDKAPKLISLAKTATLSLEKNNLTHVKAKTAFIIDASGSMTNQYQNGQVQQTLYRVFPLGVHFDDDEELETWAFANKSKKLSNVTFSNYESYVKEENKGWQNWMKELEAGYNNEPVVIREVIEYFSGLEVPEFTKGTIKTREKSTGFFGLGSKKVKPEDIVVETNEFEFAPCIKSKTPVFIIFISDGGVSHNEHIEYLIKWSSTLPIFWQFVGIGGSSYGALEKIDDMKGRYLDNADFFSIDDLNQLTESQLYDRMMGEFPKWLEQAHSKGLIDDYKI